VVTRVSGKSLLVRLLSRDNSVGSVVLARSFCAMASSFDAYRSMADMLASYSSPCAKICFAITSLPTELLRLRASPKRTAFDSPYCPKTRTRVIPCNSWAWRSNATGRFRRIARHKMALKEISPNDSFTLSARLRRWLDESPPATRNRISPGGDRFLHRRLVRYHVLFVMRLMTREVHIAGIVPEPCEMWMLQTARNLTDACDGFLRDMRFLIHDRSTLFTEQFREILKSAGVEPLRLPVRSPNLNAFAERFVRSIKEPCVERMIFFGESALRRAVSEFALHSITKNETIRGWRTRSSAPSWPHFQLRVQLMVVSGWADCFATTTEKPRENLSCASFWTVRGSSPRD
jgi:hypothetical protein